MAQAKSKKVVREDGNGIDFNFVNGHILECKVDQLPDDIKHDLMLHGLSQKVGDSYAGATTVEEAIESATAVFKQLSDGQWNAVRESTGGAPRSNQLVEALMEVTGRTAAEVTAMLDSKTEDERKQIRSHAKVQAAIAAIRARKAQEAAAKAAAAASSDTTSLF